MDLAGAVAKELNHSWLGPDHVLLALLHPESLGAARDVLESIGLGFEQTRAVFVASMGDPFDPHQRGQTVPPATLLLLEAAKRKAVELRDKGVGSEHVLLALTERWDHGPLTCQLARRGVEGEEVQRRTLIVTEAAGEGEHDWPPISLLPCLALTMKRDDPGSNSLHRRLGMTRGGGETGGR
ncbi:MAG: Clp protease N-terminal domain-containing protein [Acidimicrobiales bacterium]